METYSAREIAAEIRRRLPDVPTKKMHKLLYYCQGYHMSALDAPLFSDAVEAWDRGPVVADLWRDEKYGAAVPAAVAPRHLDQAALNTVGYVLSRYGSMTGADLETLTHTESPWILADNRRRQTGDQRMDLAEIRDHFKSAAATDEEPFDGAFDDEQNNYEPPQSVIREWLAEAEKRRTEYLRVDDLSALDHMTRRP